MQKAKKKLHRTYRLGRSHARRVRRHPASLPVVLFVFLVAFSGGILLYGLKHHARQLTITPNQNFIVIVKVDGTKQTVPTDADTVGQLLDKLHIKLSKSDRVEPEAKAPITVDNFLINVYRSAPITIVDGTKTTMTSNAAATARSMVTQAGLQLYPEDIVVAKPVDNIVAENSIGSRVMISRATPIEVSMYSANLVMIRTHAKTVGDWVKSADVRLSNNDTLKPAASTPITAGMQVSVVRNGVHTVTVNEAISAPVKTIIDTSLSFGSQAVRQEGSAGMQIRTYQVVVENGNEVSRTLIQSIVTVQPVERIVAKGNTVNIPADKQAVMAAAGISPNNYAYVDYIFSRESHWNAAAVSGTGKYVGLGQTSQARLSAACPGWQTDPVCQTRFFSGYAGRYGGWEGSYNAWLRQGWW